MARMTTQAMMIRSRRAARAWTDCPSFTGSPEIFRLTLILLLDLPQLNLGCIHRFFDLGVLRVER